MYEFFKERLGEERHNRILQEAVGKTYEELLEERDILAARVIKLEEENERLKAELEEGYDVEIEQPPVMSTKDWIMTRAERVRRDGIPMDQLEGRR
ncbi:MAG: hypothetical protein IKL08_06050 [Clostridia bacterium]|nr:hypothetical protein [Clostridia bacterium]